MTFAYTERGVANGSVLATNGSVLATNGSVLMANGSVVLENESIRTMNDSALDSNQTSDNLSIETERPYFAETEIPIFLSVLLVVIVVGNLTVLLAIWLSKRGVSSRMNFFILHMAIADLSVGLLLVLPNLMYELDNTWVLHDAVCKLNDYVQTVVIYASTYVLVSLSIDRMDAIARPLNFSCRDRRAKILIGTAWLLSLIFSTPSLGIMEVRWVQDHYGEWNWVCSSHVITEEGHYQILVTALALAMFVVPAFIIIVCYVMIIVTVFRKAKLMAVNAGGGRNGTDRQPLDGTSSSRGIIPQAKIRTIKMTLVITIVFVLCWSPYFVFNLLDVYLLLPANGPNIVRLRAFIQAAAPLNSAVNPIIYGIFSTRICQNLRRIPALDWILSKICCHPSPAQNNRPSRSTSMATYTLYADSHRTTGGSHSRRTSDQQRRMSGSYRGGPQCLHSPLKPREADIVMRNLQLKERDCKLPVVS